MTLNEQQLAGLSSLALANVSIEDSNSCASLLFLLLDGSFSCPPPSSTSLALQVYNSELIYITTRNIIVLFTTYSNIFKYVVLKFIIGKWCRWLQYLFITIISSVMLQCIGTQDQNNPVGLFRSRIGNRVINVPMWNLGSSFPLITAFSNLVQQSRTWTVIIS